MNLRQLAHALGGEVAGQQVLCPGPGHSPRDRSLCIRLAASAPDGFVVTSFAGDDPLDCKDYVRDRLGLPAFERGAKAIVTTTPRVLAQVETKLGGVSAPSSDDITRIRRAHDVWLQAANPNGTLVEIYLRKHRLLELPWEAANEAIRFHPACPWRDETTGTTMQVPAMVAAMRSIETGEITAIHRTRLAPEGRKVDRKMLGMAGGAAIMLCPYSAVGSSLAIGEGIETCLAAWQLGWSNVWAMGSVGSIASFPLLVGLDTLVLLAETGDNGASAKAIDTVAARYHDAGRRVIVVQPNVEGDLNDAIRSEAA